MLSTIRKKLKRDRASSTVEMIILIPLIIAIFITTIDWGIYTHNRSVVGNAARDAARTIAIFGGDGSNTQATSLEKSYGAKRSTSCSGLSNNPITKAAYKNTSSAVECQLMKTLANSNGLVQLGLTAVNCGPAKTNAIGQRVFCDVSFAYQGIPGSALAFTQLNKGRVVGNAQSEVNLSGINLQNR